jgi:hypothetical protein
MTDLCYEEEAERMCEHSITKAFEYDADSLDANQALASLRLSQCRTNEASAIMTTVYQRVKSLRNIIRSRTIEEELAKASNENELNSGERILIILSTCLLS